MAEETFDVVFICTGNRFRSAIAEALLNRLTAGLPVQATSAGTLELGAVPALPEALELAPSLDLDLSLHRARCVRGIDLSDADLVLGFEYLHIATAVADAGARRERTFTLPELDELLGTDSPEEAGGVDPVAHAREAVQRAHETRLRAAGPPLELADPLGGTPEVFRMTAFDVKKLTERLARRLFGA
jgi:protein-tyrosine-phosphatase